MTDHVQGSKRTTNPIAATIPNAIPKVPAQALSPVPSEQFTYMSQMDTEGKFFAFWKSNDTHIIIELHVKTRGYIGFGISPHGSMYPADIIFGWVSSSGTVHLKDCHTVGHVSPVVDQSQDVQLLHGEENDFGTVIKFVRKLDTCDNDDIKITDDTMRLIYAYHPDDPSSMDSLVWHGASRRGTRSVLMLSGPKISVYSLPSDSKHFDFTGKQIHVPGKDTTYMCTGFKFPDLDRKHHMIKYVPIIQPGNERHVHHVVLHYCTDPIDSSLDGIVYECYKNTPPVLRGCYNIVDSSGIRIIFTPTLRKHDAASLIIGESSNKLQLIPPYEKDFLDQGFCSEQCLQKGLGSKPDGINVFAVFHHMHLLGRKISTRIVRNGTEKEPIALDDNYDFDYQDIRVLSPERKIYAGGLSTREEMCFSFLMYYPKADVQVCVSQKSYDNLPHSGLNKSPYQYAVETLNTWNWTDSTVRQQYKELIRNTSYFHHCSGKRLYPERENYTNKVILDRDGLFTMHWLTNNTHIIIKLLVKTNGYIGFGISPNGKMYPSDVVIGWVNDNGQAHLKDYHTIGHTAPVLDKSQDWTLIYGKENHNETLLEFTRKLDTCDPDDIKITDDTIRIIYSYHPNDPQSSTSLQWHGASRRGTKSLMLLSGPRDVYANLPADTKTFEFRNKNVNAIDPVLRGRSFECYSNGRVQEFRSCYLAFTAWAIGAGAFNYPDNVGVSLGTSRDPSFFLMETHYDNPTLKTDIVDNSGIRIYYTPTLRQHDAGLLYAGQTATNLQIIPPFEDKFVSRGYCSETCLRHVKQKPIASDNHYDYNYQDFRALKEERTILPGDSLIVDCIYNSSGKSVVTYGGLSTRDEMCIAFLMYYPRIPLEMCASEPKYDNVNNNRWVGANIVSKWDWKDPSVHQRFQEVMKNTTYSLGCSGKHLNPKKYCLVNKYDFFSL
ncbi:hypothetical protein KUTeg_022164 [Tegillarca granosa]|uniref:DOMON domain-containing protein n=1 Tax=Tegillarca granosa TaxID=220873 RepID=A0ABQ9EB06_TEGGR|nr:hypothetical protein KUTeg_022164 [Tegillarca granosa]